MFRSRGENLRSVYILLFLNVAFFLLEHQDPQKYARLFRFDGDSVRDGEVWRLFTYQFTQAGQGFIETLTLFVTLLLLYVMGSVLEEEWGTFHFLTLFFLSSLGSAAVAAIVGVPLLSAYFVYFTLLFVYASAFAQPFYVRALAMFSLALLLYGVFSGGMANLAALGGAALAYSYYLSQRISVKLRAPAPDGISMSPRVRIDTTALHNSARYAAIKQALGSGNDAEIERLVSQCERDTVAGVNICPPADYKPENVDGYCIRCEGFAECSARYLRLNRPRATAGSTLVVSNPDPR